MAFLLAVIWALLPQIQSHEFEIRYATSSSPNYETLQENYTFDLAYQTRGLELLINCPSKE